MTEREMLMELGWGVGGEGARGGGVVSSRQLGLAVLNGQQPG